MMIKNKTIVVSIILLIFLIVSVHGVENDDLNTADNCSRDQIKIMIEEYYKTKVSPVVLRKIIKKKGCDIEHRVLIELLSEIRIKNQNDSLIDAINRANEKRAGERYLNVLPCLKKDIEKVLMVNSRNLYTLSDYLDVVDNTECAGDTVRLKKLLIQILNEEQLGREYTHNDRLKYDAALRIVIGNDAWDDNVEKVVEKRMVWFKKNKSKRYYWYAGVLVKFSRNWYRYMESIYHDTDMTSLHGRNSVFKETIRRFNNSGNKADLAKVESLLFAELIKNHHSDIRTLDTYLSLNSESYKKSKQRLNVINKRDKYYLSIKTRNEQNYKWVLKYFNDVRKYLSSLDSLTEYTPPLKIE